jgi:hypothetical protein
VHLVAALIREAGPNGYSISAGTGAWDVQSLAEAAVQTTGHSCGLWVLATIGAMLSGRHVTNLKGRDMVRMRTLLRSHIVQLPVYKGLE